MALIIGDEVWTEWKVDPASTDTREKRLLFRVVDFARCARYENDMIGELLPVVKMIGVFYRDMAALDAAEGDNT